MTTETELSAKLKSHDAEIKSATDIANDTASKLAALEAQVKADTKSRAEADAEAVKIKAAEAKRFEEYDEAFKKIKTDAVKSEVYSKDATHELTEKGLPAHNRFLASKGLPEISVDEALNLEKALEIALHEDGEEHHGREKLMRGASDEVKKLAGDIIKSLGSGSAEGGPVYIPPAFASRIEMIARDVNPIRQYAMVMNTSIGKVQRIAQGTTTAAYFTDGLTVDAALAEQGGALPLGVPQNVNVRNLGVTHAVSMAQAEDAGFSVSEMLTTAVGMDFGVIEGNAFINGNGTAPNPGGLLSLIRAHVSSGAGKNAELDAATITATNPDTTYFGKFAQVYTSTAGDIASGDDAEKVIDMVAALPTMRMPNARFVMHRTTLAKLRGLRAKSTGQDGQWLIQNQFVNNVLETRLLGMPVVLNDSMPRVTGTGDAGKAVIFFGDISMAFTIAQARGIRMLRDPYSKKPNTQYQFTSRHGAMPFMPDAGVVLRLASA